MSADTTNTEYTLTELLAMDEAEAKATLTVRQFERWESINDHHDRYEDRTAEWDEIDADVTDTVVFADRSDLATDVDVMGNALSVYYDPSDDGIRKPAEALQERFDVDDEEELNADDVPDDAVAFVEEQLAEMVTAAVIEWNGTHWDDIGPDGHDKIKAALKSDWGLAALMDAWVEIQVAVESNRDERMERIEKFRNPERRGDR